MTDEGIRMQTDGELAEQINQAMDAWDTIPTPEERARITAEFVAQQRAWQRKLASLPPEDRARVAAEEAADAETDLAAAKHGLIRAEAARVHLREVNAQADRIVAHAEERIQSRVTADMHPEEIEAIRIEEAERAQAELRAWTTAHPPPTVADDERAIENVLGQGTTDE